MNNTDSFEGSKYSIYTMNQIDAPSVLDYNHEMTSYGMVAQKLLSLCEDEETKEKMRGILYEGGFEDFSVNGDYHMQKEVLFRNNPKIEARKRLNMAYLLLTNPQVINTIHKTEGHFFHGTNANALPSILRYGINSFDKSNESNIPVITGEEWSRSIRENGFVSMTDCIDVAMMYASNITVDENSFSKNLLNFGIIFGISLEDMSDIKTVSVQSNVPEVGVFDNLPIDHIKFIMVPEEKIEFVRKMIGQKPIEIVPMNFEDRFFNSNDYASMMEILDQRAIEQTRPQAPVYSEDDIKPVVFERKTSDINETVRQFKTRINTIPDELDFDKGEER